VGPGVKSDAYEGGEETNRVLFLGLERGRTEREDPIIFERFGERGEKCREGPEVICTGALFPDQEKGTWQSMEGGRV